MSLSPTSSRSGNGGSSSFFAQASDPGAVGAGAIWVNTSDSLLSTSIRNTDDSDWIEFWRGDPGNGIVYLTMNETFQSVEIIDSNGSQALHVYDPLFTGTPNASVQTAQNVIDNGHAEGDATFHGMVQSALALLPGTTDQQQVLNPGTCTTADIANALIALGLAKAA